MVHHCTGFVLGSMFLAVVCKSASCLSRSEDSDECIHTQCIADHHCLSGGKGKRQGKGQDYLQNQAFALKNIMDE